MQTETRTLAWRTAAGNGRELTTVTFGPSGCVAVGHVVDADAAGLDIRYRVECDALWRTRLVRVDDALTGSGLEVRSDGLGHWVAADGSALPGLDGAIDVDVSVTPFTNTLPIRRLRLDRGGSAEIVTAYVSVPRMSIEPDPQRYTRLEANLYRYESLDSDFCRDVQVDEEGFVVEYPGLFSRC
jgi:hypothetical protein